MQFYSHNISFTLFVSSFFWSGSKDVLETPTCHLKLMLEQLYQTWERPKLI